MEKGVGADRQRPPIRGPVAALYERRGGFRSAVIDSRYNIERLPVAALYERRGWLSVRQPSR
jgi:hypothetical protein